MKDEDNAVSVVLSVVAIGIAFGAVMFLPLIAMAALPLVGILMWYISWSENPSRLEKISKKHTWELYEEAKKRVAGPMNADEIFDDYVPPYKNLGALFIKAYKIATDEKDPS